MYTDMCIKLNEKLMVKERKCIKEIFKRLHVISSMNNFKQISKRLQEIIQIPIIKIIWNNRDTNDKDYLLRGKHRKFSYILHVYIFIIN